MPRRQTLAFFGDGTPEAGECHLSSPIKTIKGVSEPNALKKLITRNSTIHGAPVRYTQPTESSARRASAFTPALSFPKLPSKARDRVDPADRMQSKADSIHSSEAVAKHVGDGQFPQPQDRQSRGSSECSAETVDIASPAAQTDELPISQGVSTHTITHLLQYAQSFDGVLDGTQRRRVDETSSAYPITTQRPRIEEARSDCDEPVRCCTMQTSLSTETDGISVPTSSGGGQDPQRSRADHDIRGSEDQLDGCVACGSERAQFLTEVLDQDLGIEQLRRSDTKTG